MKPPIEDLDQLMAIMALAFDPLYGEAWNRRQVEDALLIGNCHYFLIGEDGNPVDESNSPAAGFYLSRSGFGEEELLLFAVAPSHRARGLGTRMLEHLTQSAMQRGAKRLLLEMRRGNTAETLYRAHGFEPIGVRSDYYRTSEGNPIDAITFAKPIES